MTWAKLDDSMWHNEKVLKLLELPNGLEALGMHMLALSFCADNMTDGVVEKSRLKALTGCTGQKVTALLGALKQVGMWSTQCPTQSGTQGGTQWHIHDFLEYNPSRAEVLAKRAIEAERQRRHRTRVTRDAPRDLIGPVPVPVRVINNPSLIEPVETVDKSSTSVAALATRLADFCEWGGIDEAHAVMSELSQWVDTMRLDELIGSLALLKNPPKRPRYLIPVARNWAAERGIAIPEASLRAIQ